MIKAKKVRIHVDKGKEELFFQHAGAARFAWNWAKAASDEFYKTNSSTIQESDLRKQFTLLKQQQGFEWTNDVNNNAMKQPIREFITARSRSFKTKTHTNFKCRDKSVPSFYVDCCQLQLKNGEIYIPSIGWFKYSGYDLANYKKDVNQSNLQKKSIYIGLKPESARVTFDGLHWNASIIYNETDLFSTVKHPVSIGVDLGLKTFAVIATVDKISKELIGHQEVASAKPQFIKLAKRKLHFDRKVSKKINKKENKSLNYRKLLQKRLKITQRMTNIQSDKINQTVSAMVKTKPSRIVIEDLNTRGMMKNRRLAKWIAFNQFYKFRTSLESKCREHGIELTVADRFFASTKTCSKCGAQKFMSLSERTYVCPECGAVLDRDLNAAINLANY